MRTTIPKTNNWTDLKSLLKEILNDQVIIQFSPKELLQYYKDICEDKDIEITAQELFSYLEELEILCIENPEIGDAIDESILVSRVLVHDQEAGMGMYLFANQVSQKFPVLTSKPNLKYFALISRFPKRPITKWQFAWLQFSPLWKRYIITLIFLAIAAVISVLPVVAIDPIFNTIVPRGQIPELLILGIALVLAQAIGSASQMLASVFANLFENDIAFRSFLGLVDRFLMARPLSLPQRDIGLWSQTFRTALAFTSSIKTIVVRIPLAIFTIILNCIVFGVALARPWVIVLLIILSMIPAIVNVFFGWRVGKIGFKLITVNSRIDQLLYKTITDVGDIRSLGIEGQFDRNFIRYRKDLNNITLRMNAWSEAGIFLNSTLTAVLTAVILFFYSASDDISQGSYLVIFVAFSSVAGGFTQLAQALSQILASAPTYFSKNALRDISDFSYYSTPSSRGEKETKRLQTIELINVSFSYLRSQPVLENLEMLFEQGKNYAITGDSGSGKSSLLKVIGGIYNPDSGDLLINQIANTEGLNRLKEFNVLFIPQQAKLLGDNFREFIDAYRVYGDQQIWAALKEVGMDGFVRDLPMGLMTVVSEFSDDLSTGQIQLLHIARVVLMKPDLVLSDEPTSHLTEEVHRLMLQKINQSSSIHITTLHRLSAVEDFDIRIKLKSLLSSSQ